MTRTVRSRRTETASQPLYARVLHLRHLAPSGLLCFVFLEGAVVLGILLALAELVSWWGVLVLPITVALMVKFNDMVAGTFAIGPVATEPATARATVLRSATMPSEIDEQSFADGNWSSGSAAELSWFSPTAGGAFPAGASRSATEAGRPVANRSSAGDSAGARLAMTHGHGAPELRPESAGQVRRAAAETVSAGGCAQGVVYGRSQGAGLDGAGHGYVASREQQPTGAETARPGAGGSAVRSPWAEQLDVRQQVARQAAARRYE